jgi:excisionase family DNA binding protein
METNTHTPKQPTEDGHSQAPSLLTVPEAARRLAIGRSTAYVLIGAGELEVIHIGRAARVPDDSVDALIARKRAAGDHRAGVRITSAPSDEKPRHPGLLRADRAGAVDSSP